MTKQLRLPGSGVTTKTERLVRVLADHRWHATKELARRIGHTFHVAIYNARRGTYHVERRCHPSAPYQHQYRIPDNSKNG